jgi:hypothetical protein
MQLNTDQILKLKNVVGFDVINQYMCAILRIWERQRDMGGNNIPKLFLLFIYYVDQLRSIRVQSLLENVKTRKLRIKRKIMMRNSTMKCRLME